MKRRILIPLDDETSEKGANVEHLRKAFNVGVGWMGSVKGELMTRFTFYWQESETVLEVVNKLSFVKTVEDAEVAADYIRRHTGLPLKSLPRERDY